VSKLQRALEKAKEARRDYVEIFDRKVVEIPSLAECEEIGFISTERTGVAEVSEKINVVSPIYSQSRTVQLDAEAMVSNRCVAIAPDLEEVESYRILRTQILNSIRETDGKLIMISSALPGEGKTLTAINLSLTFARELQQTVLLVDCDLKKQSIHEVMGFKNDKGLVDHLLGECPASDLFVWPTIARLTVISGGKTTNESSDIIGSPQMKALVEDMKNRYPERYIFFDVPPILTGADALTFAPLVDHILMVVWANETSLAEVKKAAQMMPKEKLLGLVLNRFHPEV